MTNTVDIKLRGQNQQLDQVLGKSMASITKFGRRVTAVFAVVAGAFAFRKAFQLANKLIGLSKEQAVEEAKLAAVIKATGGAAGFSAEQMKKLASNMQEVTGIGDEVVLATQAILATFKNIRGEEFKTATMLAADMAAVMGTDLKSSALQVGKALNDPIKGLTMLTRVGVTFTDEQKAMIQQMVQSGDVMGAQKVILGELESQFGGAAEAMNKANGPMNDLIGHMGDLGERIGGLLQPMLESVLVPALQLVLKYGNAFADWAEGSKDWLMALTENIQNSVINGVEFLARSTVAAYSVSKAVWENLGTIVELQMTRYQLQLVQAANITKFVLTEQIPEFAAWFFRNWREIFTDVAMVTKTITENIASNLSLIHI